MTRTLPLLLPVFALRVVPRVAGDDDLAVGLDGDGADEVVAAGEVGQDDAAGTEGGVQRAVGIVPRQGEVFVAGAVGAIPGGEDIAVGLDQSG